MLLLLLVISRSNAHSSCCLVGTTHRSGNWNKEEEEDGRRERGEGTRSSSRPSPLHCNSDDDAPFPEGGWAICTLVCTREREREHQQMAIVVGCVVTVHVLLAKPPSSFATHTHVVDLALTLFSLPEEEEEEDRWDVFGEQQQQGSILPSLASGRYQGLQYTHNSSAIQLKRKRERGKRTGHQSHQCLNTRGHARHSSILCISHSYIVSLSVYLFMQ